MDKPNIGEDGFQWEVGMVCENSYGWQAEVRRVEDDAVIIGRSVFHLDGKPSAPYGGMWVTPDPGNSVKRIVKWPEP